jgi:hypothetical protein
MSIGTRIAVIALSLLSSYDFFHHSYEKAFYLLGADGLVLIGGIGELLYDIREELKSARVSKK